MIQVGLIDGINIRQRQRRCKTWKREEFDLKNVFFVLFVFFFWKKHINLVGGVSIDLIKSPLKLGRRYNSDETFLYVSVWPVESKL